MAERQKATLSLEEAAELRAAPWEQLSKGERGRGETLAAFVLSCSAEPC